MRDPSAALRAQGPLTRPVMQDPSTAPRRPVAVATGFREAGASPAPLPRPGARTGFGAPRTGFGLPSLRRNVCPHFYMTGLRGSVPIQAPHLLKALVRQEPHGLALPAARGGAHGGGVRQRRLPRLPLQPVRLLRGRPGAVTGVEGSRPPGLVRRLDHRPGGTRAVRDPAGPGPDEGAAGRPRAPRGGDPRRAHRRHERQGQRGGARRRLPSMPRGTAPVRRPSRTWSAIASGSGSPGTPSPPPTSRASSGQGSRSRTGSRGATARRPSSSCSPRSRSATSRTPGSTSRSWRSASAAGSTRPMPGTAAWPPSRTSTSTTPSTWARPSS